MFRSKTCIKYLKMESKMFLKIADGFQKNTTVKDENIIFGITLNHLSGSPQLRNGLCF